MVEITTSIPRAELDSGYATLCGGCRPADTKEDVEIARDGTMLADISDRDVARSGLFNLRDCKAKDHSSVDPWHVPVSPLMRFDMLSLAPPFDEPGDYMNNLFSDDDLMCSPDVEEEKVFVDANGQVVGLESTVPLLDTSNNSAFVLPFEGIEVDIVSLLSGISPSPAPSGEQVTRELNGILESFQSVSDVGGMEQQQRHQQHQTQQEQRQQQKGKREHQQSQRQEGKTHQNKRQRKEQQEILSAWDIGGPHPSVDDQQCVDGSFAYPTETSSSATPRPPRTAVTTSISGVRLPPPGPPPTLAAALPCGKKDVRSPLPAGVRSAAAKRRHRMERRLPASGGGSGGGTGGAGGGGAMRRRAPLTAAEAVRGCVGAAETPLSEEEVLRRIRRVKNRESVEKCRNKQKMRLMALEHELNALRHENGMLLAVTKCVHGTYDVIATEVAAITGQRPALSC